MKTIFDTDNNWYTSDRSSVMADAGTSLAATTVTSPTGAERSAALNAVKRKRWSATVTCRPMRGRPTETIETIMSTAAVAVVVATAVFATTIVDAATLTRVVQTRYGKLQGVVRTVDVSSAGIGPATRSLATVDTFLGVPYATPPIGSNRFGPTRTPSPWDGVRLADALGPVCPQRLPDVSNETAALQRMPIGRLVYLKRLLPYLRNQSEDCLYLNIYAPSQGQCIFLFCWNEALNITYIIKTVRDEILIETWNVRFASKHRLWYKIGNSVVLKITENDSDINR